VVYHIMCGYVVCVLDCCGSVTALFYILAPTCFGSSLPSSGGFLDPSELLEIKIRRMVYLKCITVKESVCLTYRVEIKQTE
jgi:hypothetical protein